MAVLTTMASVHVMTVAAAAPKKPSTGSPTLLILVAIAAGFYFLVLRPQQQKARKLREAVKVWDVGDEVLTAGGLIGHIIDIDDDRVTLETSMGASFVVHKQYIIRKLDAEPGEAAESDEPGEYGLDDDDDEHEHEHEHEGSDEHDGGEDGSDEDDEVGGADHDEDDHDERHGRGSTSPD